MDPAKNATSSGPQFGPEANRRIDRACFDGLLLIALAYGVCTVARCQWEELTFRVGALLMILMQLSQVLSLRPKRGRLFWAMVAYSVVVFVLSSAAVGGRFRFAEMMYIENRLFEGGFTGYVITNMDRWENVLNHIRYLIARVSH